VKGIIRKLFSPNQEAEIPTQPLDMNSHPNHQSGGENPLEPHQLVVCCGQSIGRQRDHNEDALFAMTTTLTGDNRVIPFGLYIVADGMGGHQHGEVASGVAIRTMATQLLNKLYLPLLSVKPVSPDESLQEIMQSSVQDAHIAILKQVPGGGTTLTAMLIIGDQMTIAHVGDSRAYAITRDGQIDVLTRDHSLVKRLVELGQLSKDEAAIHPQRNVLYRALGQGEPFEPDVKTIHLPGSGYLLLCSDGLWSVVPEHELYQIITKAKSSEEACKRLIEAANEAGGPDNISAILIRLPG